MYGEAEDAIERRRVAAREPAVDVARRWSDQEGPSHTSLSVVLLTETGAIVIAAILSARKASISKLAAA